MPQQVSYHHLTLDDRIVVEKGLDQCLNLKELGQSIGKDPTSVSKEVRRHRIEKPRNISVSHNNCEHRATCNQREVCKWASGCRRMHCRGCIRCIDKCQQFKAIACKMLGSGKLVCNGCHRKSSCRLDKYYYRASDAHKKYCSALKTSRQGINIDVGSLTAVNALITPLIKLRGQSISHIYSTHKDDIPFSSRTLYSYIDQNLLLVRNIDLVRKVRYKPRRKTTRPTRDKAWLEGRKYYDFISFIDSNPDNNIIEMDTVEGRKGGKVLLTLHFRSTKCLLSFLLPAKTQESVLAVFNWLERSLGSRKFKKTFQVILTDNGSEFINPLLLENGISSKRMRVFYCDPNSSYQKGALEKNHEFIRYIIPKGKSMCEYSASHIKLMTSHINSFARDSLNNQTPFKMATLLMDKDLISLVGLEEIPADDVTMKPCLLKQL